jgi:hypothetical protein
LARSAKARFILLPYEYRERDHIDKRREREQQKKEFDHGLHKLERSKRDKAFPRAACTKKFSKVVLSIVLSFESKATEAMEINKKSSHSKLSPPPTFKLLCR